MACLLTAVAIRAQYSIEGRVTERGTQEGIAGVSIMLKGTSQGVISDIDGNYQFKFDSKSSAPTLVFSYLGYLSQEIKVSANQRTLNVELAPDEVGLEEVVVIGYGTVKKKDLTGAVSVANTEEMKKMTVTTVSQALQGQVSGVTVKSSGAPGETGRIFIRGISSLYSDTNPLFVIDGLPTSDTRDFNPDDIESVQVLKDASAAAIYGSRAANGVIIITTRRGKEGKMKVDFSTKFGIQRAAKTFDLMDGQEWLALQEEKYINKYGSAENFKIENRDINTNWEDEVYQTGYSQEYNLAISGGTKTANYMISSNYLKQTGIVIGPSFERITTRINGGVEYGRLKIQESALLSTSNSHDQVGSPMTDYLRMPPLLPVYTEDGGFALGGYNGAQTNGTNPVAQRELQSAQNRSYRVQGMVNGDLRITDWLHYQLNLGLEYNANIWKQRTKDGKWYPNQAPESQYIENRPSYLKTVLENLLTFQKTFGKHDVNVMAGYTEQRIDYSTIGGTVYDIMTNPSGEYFWSLGNGTNPSVTSNIGPEALRSFLGRVIYNYDNKYLLTFSIRRDGSSRFAKDNNYGNFPSVSAAWRISDEKFFEPLTSWWNTLKVKASWGKLGNEAIGNFKYTSYMNTFIPYYFGRANSVQAGSDYEYGIMPTSMVDTSLRWEEKESTNIGLESSFLNNRLTLEFDYFVNASNNLLAQVPIPMYMGSWGGDSSTTIWRNAGKIQNKGVEVSIGYRNYDHPFKYDMKLNLTHTSNKVKALGGDNTPVYGDNTKTEVGRSLGEFFLLETDGIYQSAEQIAQEGTTVFDAPVQPGDQRYRDLFGRDAEGNLVAGADGNINDDDRTYVGSPWPKLDFSYTFNASYRGFDFSMFWLGQIDKTVYNSPKYWLYNVGDNGNYAAGYEGWTEENHSQTTPKAYDLVVLRGNTTRFIENISWLRLKSIQIGYTLPKTLLKKLRIENLRVYLNAENLLTITNYEGLDPDFPGGGVFSFGVDYNSYPCVRTFGCGLQLSF